MRLVLNDIGEKSRIEEELRKGLELQEKLKAKKKAIAAENTKAKDNIKVLNSVLEKTKEEIRAAKRKLKEANNDHQAAIEETKRHDDCRSDEALEELSQRLECINTSMKALREVLIEDEKRNVVIDNDKVDALNADDKE